MKHYVMNIQCLLSNVDITLNNSIQQFFFISDACVKVGVSHNIYVLILNV